MSDLHSRLGELVPGAEVEDRGITTSTGVSSIDLRATTGKVVSDGKPAADVRITGTADAEGNFDHAPTVFISWNETGYDGQAKVETTAYNIRAASVDELEDNLDLNLPRARRQAHLQQEANVEVNQRVAARTAAESGRHAVIVATVSGSHLQLSSGGSGDFTDIILDTEAADGDDWAPVIKPAGLPPMPVPEEPREQVLDRVGRSVLQATGQFGKLKGPGSGREYLDSLLGRLRDLPHQD